MSDSYFSGLGLTDQQVDAVRCKLGPVMVVAGAGSGKTSVIAHRFIYLYKHFGIDPERILCVTFTNKAVKNVRERIMEYLPYDDYHRFQGNVNVMTFHAFCKQILLSISERREGGNMKKFVHLAKYMPIIKEILQDYPHIKAAYAVSVLLEKLRWLCKSQDRDFTEDDLVSIGVRFTVISDADKLLKKFPYSDIKAIYHRFDEELEKRQWMTLDDIILDTKKYLMEKEIMDEWCAKFDAILCDEFQDVDYVQFEILTKLCEDDDNLFCVGDPDQSIYGFRGALPNIFLKLKEYFNNRGLKVQVKKLEKNFRSTPEILTVANQLINSGKESSEFHKDLFTSNRSGEIPVLDILESPKDQAAQVVQRIEELKAQGVKPSDIMVLGRNQSHYKHIKNAFLFSSIHYED